MASIRKCASEVIDTARDGIGWFALWKTGRSWHVMEVYADDYDYDTGALILGFPEDKQEIDRILTEDPHAVMLNGYYCNLGDLEYMTVNSLADALRWQYETGGNALANWTFKSETPEDSSDSETTTSEPDNTGNETQPYIPAASCTGLSLSEEEIKFFEDTVARIKYCVDVPVPVEIVNHDQLTGKNKEALGICWARYDEAGNPVPFRITIDEFFVHECFVAREEPSMMLADQSLEQVIAHEIAHLHYWRHGKKHTELTRYICRLIEKGEPHGMGVDATPDAPEAGPVLMAAMRPTNMKIAENYDQFVERVSEAERTVLNSPIGQELTTELLKMKLAQNPNMTQEEWAQTKSKFMMFLFAMFVKETPEAMKELGRHVWNEMQAVP